MKARRVFPYFINFITNFRKRILRILCVLLPVLVMLGYAWTLEAEQEAHISPDYLRVDITAYLERQISWQEAGTAANASAPLSEQDYTLLTAQTGLSRVGIDALWRQGRQQELLFLQERLFAPVEMVCAPNTIISREERLTGKSLAGTEQTGEKAQASYASTCFPALEDGDIMISFNCHVLGWRNGHAALVVDADKGYTLEARVLGTNSAVLTMEHWCEYPAVAVLRLKDTDAQTRAQIAQYAAQQLCDIPYRLLSYKRKNSNSDIASAEEPVTGTHCAHLIWEAYARFGYDLDSDGGRIVTPRDIYESDLLEIVQVYGIKMEKTNS